MVLDLLVGDDGDDMLYGDGQADEIYGNNGNDTAFGGAENDTIYGGFGIGFAAGRQLALISSMATVTTTSCTATPVTTSCLGAAETTISTAKLAQTSFAAVIGNDGLFGGTETNDILWGEEGKDRLLYFVGDALPDVSSEDARLEFRNLSSNWTNREVEVIDQGLALLHQRTGNTRLLQGTLTSEPVVFNKKLTLPISNPPAMVRVGTNELVTLTEQVFNPVTQQVETVTRMERQLSFAEWNENDASMNARYTAEVPREMAHTWATSEAITAVLPNQGSYWSSFLLFSGWTQTRPADIQFYDVSLDSEWFFRKDALFVEEFSKTNPAEDFASVWKLYFDPAGAAERSRLVTKISKLDSLFSMLEVF